MSPNGKLTIITVSTSPLFNSTVSNGFINKQVIQTSNILQASSKLDKFRINVMIIDTEAQSLTYPYIKSYMEKYNLMIILVSPNLTADAQLLRSGAKDLILKPQLSNSSSVRAFINDLSKRIDAYVGKIPVQSFSDINNVASDRETLIAIASSTGGTEALQKILQEFPAVMPPILIVQHMPPVFTGLFADRLDKCCKINVKEAKDNEYIKKSTAYIAPGDFHMKMVKRDSKLAIEIIGGEKVNCVRPAADVLFNSIAPIMAKNVIGVILTGMGYDGARGLLDLRSKGARTIGQDNQSSVVYGMPKAAFNMGAVEKQLPLEKIAKAIIEMI